MTSIGVLASNPLGLAGIRVHEIQACGLSIDSGLRLFDTSQSD